VPQCSMKEKIFGSPQHPYTWLLLRSIPSIDASRRRRLPSIEGVPPDLMTPPPGCKFSPRCPFRVERCSSESPSLESVGPSHTAACHVTMRRALGDGLPDVVTDTRPGAASGVHGPAIGLARTAGRPAASSRQDGLSDSGEAGEGQ
jgi:oligopeptide/dipeptide ABC transporter ATP-binding protein